MKYHVHIYPIHLKAEADIEADNIEEAQRIALQKAKEGELPFYPNNAEGRFTALAWKMLDDVKGGPAYGPEGSA